MPRGPAVGIVLVLLAMVSLGAAGTMGSMEGSSADEPVPSTAADEVATTQLVSGDDSLAIPLAVGSEPVGVFAWAVDANVFYPGSVARPASFAGIRVDDHVPAASPFFFAWPDLGVEVRQGETHLGAMYDPRTGSVNVKMAALFSLVLTDQDTAHFLFSAPGADRIELTVEIFSSAPGASFGTGFVSADTGAVLLPQDMAPDGQARAAAFGAEAQAGLGMDHTVDTPAGHMRFVDWRFADTTGKYSFSARTTTETWRESFTGTRFGHPQGSLGHDFAALATRDPVDLRFSHVASATLFEGEHERDTYPIVTFSLPL